MLGTNTRSNNLFYSGRCTATTDIPGTAKNDDAMTARHETLRQDFNMALNTAGTGWEALLADHSNRHKIDLICG
jgi:hypothetical protein